MIKSVFANHKVSYVFLSCFILVHPLFVYPAPVLDQRIMISSSPNPVGSGARAMGMGGAFIGIADDATAASWNPGGLYQIRYPHISCVGSYLKRYDDTDYRAYPDASDHGVTANTDLNYVSISYPLKLFGRPVIASLNYQHMFNFYKKSSIEFDNDSDKYFYEFDQDGSLYSLSPAIGIGFIPNRLGVGFTFNCWDDPFSANKWRVDYSQKVLVQGASDSFWSIVNHSDVYTFNGRNYNIGVHWQAVKDKLSIGGVFKSGFAADLKHEHIYRFDQQNVTINTSSCFDEKMNMPPSFGIGIVYRLNDQIRISADIYRTFWDEYYITVGSKNKISPISGKNIDEVSISPTTQVRVGIEYLSVFRNKILIPFRAGVFYDPEPSERDPDDFYGLTLGSGFLYKSFRIEAAYQYRFGRNVRTVEMGGAPSSSDVNEHSLLFTLVIDLSGRGWIGDPSEDI